ncbi:MAG: envelope stress response membrane protein PspB [Pseudomonadota bacterium]
MEPEFLIGIIAILSLFVILPGMLLHYITLWRKQRALMPDDEKMLEDLWRSAKRMERRIETLEALIEGESAARDARSTPRDTDYS